MPTLKWVVAILGVLLGKLPFVLMQSSPCEFGEFRRVGQTRFFVKHNPTRGDYVDFKGAVALCKKKGLKMPRINSITQFASLGRSLERFVNLYKLQDTWYWLDAKYFPKDEIYKWQDGQSIDFTSYFYRLPRPTGVAGHVNHNHSYELERDDATQCLTLALPWPGAFGGNVHPVIYGHSTTFDEKACVSKKKRHAMCETENPECFAKVDDFFEISVDPIKQQYFDDGNWIFGRRRYIVNWGMRNINESRAYCAKYGLELYNPERYRDTCLIPFLKMWSRNLTATNFWTDWSYDRTSEKFRDSKGNVVAQFEAVEANWTEDASGGSSRSNKRDQLFCVSMNHVYELRGQMPCPDPSLSACVWNYINYVPANCKNVQATICQHANQTSRTCQWKSAYIKNVTHALNETALSPFGFSTNVKTYRSKYKQAFGSLLCAKGSRMARQNSTFYKDMPTQADSIFKYDYNETYWVIDEEGFNKDRTSMCTVSVQTDPVTNTRALKKVPCLSWQFYLCDKVDVPFRKIKFPSPGDLDWKWNDRPTPRYYPILKTTP